MSNDTNVAHVTPAELDHIEGLIADAKVARKANPHGPNYRENAVVNWFGKHGERVVTELRALRAELVRATRELEDERKDHLEDLEDRDNNEDFITRIAEIDLGCTEEWSNLHDHRSDCIRQGIQALKSDLSRVTEELNTLRASLDAAKDDGAVEAFSFKLAEYRTRTGFAIIDRHKGRDGTVNDSLSVALRLDLIDMYTAQRTESAAKDEAIVDLDKLVDSLNSLFSDDGTFCNTPKVKAKHAATIRAAREAVEARKGERDGKL